MYDKRQLKRAALRAAFPKTIPIMMGYVFLGIAYGIFMKTSGFPWYFPLLTSILVFSGTMEFVGVNVLAGAFDPLSAFVLTLMVSARHLFYGLSMLRRYKNTGRKKPYLIFGLSDETFSVNLTVDPPEGVDRGWFMFFITLLDQCYWVTGATLGGIFGSLIHFNVKGLDFVMTALLLVVFLEQWMKDKKHWTALIGLGATAACLLIFGSKDFIIPSMIAIIGILTLLRAPLERRHDLEKAGEAE